jgi:putative tryptophan/tyrosine transport system substrate-binding protein
MRRRNFIKGIVGSATAWPLAARAQQPNQKRRIGVLMNQAAADSQTESYKAAFLQGLQEFGWTVGRNIQIEYRYADGSADRVREYAAELVSLTPDVILATGNFGVAPLRQATRTLPIVFVAVTDPVGGGYVASLARPGGNATGFANFEYGLSGKWLELLKEVAPRVTRAGVLRGSPSGAGDVGQLGAIQSIGRSLGIEVSPIDVEDLGHAVTSFASAPNGGLIVVSGAVVLVERDLIISLAAQHRLPTIYPNRAFVTDGGLICYGVDVPDQFRRAAGYVDRILKGEKPSDLPIQAPTKFDLAINLKTAKALGLAIPATLLATADKVIE